jgi:hypothetical protein
MMSLLAVYRFALRIIHGAIEYFSSAAMADSNISIINSSFSQGQNGAQKKTKLPHLLQYNIMPSLGIRTSAGRHQELAHGILAKLLKPIGSAHVNGYSWYIKYPKNDGIVGQVYYSLEIHKWIKTRKTVATRTLEVGHLAKPSLEHSEHHGWE